MKFWILVVTVTILSSCNLYKEVEMVSVQEVRMTGLDTKGISAEVDVKLNNPNAYKIVITKSDMNVWVNGDDLGKIDLQENVKLAKKEQGIYTLKMGAEYAENGLGFLEVLLKLLFANTAKVKADGFIVGRGFIFKKKVEIIFEEDVDISGVKQ